MIIFWVLVFLVLGLGLLISILVYCAGILLTRITQRRWLEDLGADLIKACFLAIEATSRSKAGRGEKDATTTIEQ